MPEDLKDLDPEVRIRKIVLRSLTMMLLGTVVVLIFSDPMVDVLNEFAHLNGIPPFFISFILAPLASNAPELLASFS